MKHILSILEIAFVFLSITNGSFAQAQGGWNEFKAAVAKRESGGSSAIVNQYGYAGLYQMGTAALIDAGYIKAGTPSKDNSAMNDPSNWTGKDGVYTLNQYLGRPEAQNNAWEAYQAQNWKTMTSMGLTQYSGKTMADGTQVTDSGLIFASQFGVGKVQAYLQNGGSCVPGKGTVTNDGNGVCVAEYMKKGAGYDVSEFTKKAEDLANFKKQESADTGNANGNNSAQGVNGSGDSFEDVGCWPCKILQPLATPLDAFLARGDEIGRKYGVFAASMMAGFGLVFLVGGAFLGLFQNWRQIGGLLMGLTVVAAVLLSPGWLWNNIASPIFNAVVAMGPEFSSGTGGGAACSSSNSSGDLSGFKFSDETNGYDIARRMQAADQLGGSGRAISPGSLDESSTASGGAISQIVSTADCSIRASIAQPSNLLSISWWGVKKNLKSSLWAGLSNVPLILQTAVIFVVYIAYTVVIGILFAVAMFQVAIGAAMIPLTLPAALFKKSRPMSWWSVKMVAEPAIHLVLIGMVSSVLNLAMKQLMDSYGFGKGNNIFDKIISDGAFPLELFVSCIGAMLLALFVMRRCEGWAGSATNWLSYSGGSMGSAALGAWQAQQARIIQTINQLNPRR